MRERIAAAVAAALFQLSGGAATVQTQAGATTETPMTLIGCLQPESGPPAPDATAAPPDATTAPPVVPTPAAELVLVTAAALRAPQPDQPVADCTTPPAGESFRLTGSGERELGWFVGRQIEITGMVSGPSGGARELRVTSFTVTTDPTAQQAAATPGAPAAQRVQGLTGELPATAGPLPIIGAVGVLALLGGLALRRRWRW